MVYLDGWNYNEVAVYVTVLVYNTISYHLLKENKMKTTVFSLLFVLFSLGGCSVKHELTTESKKVRLYDELPTNMNCEYKGEIIGSEANILTFLFISNRDITVSARTDLRNQAIELGGNSVEVQNADFTYTTSTVFIGHVYNCVSK